MTRVRLIGLVLCFAFGAGAPACGEVLWHEDFESVACGSIPAGWQHGLGNSDFGVDCSVSCEGESSLRAFGLIGQCWAAVVASPIHPNFTYLDNFVVEFRVRNGSESVFGCHPFRASLEMRFFCDLVAHKTPR